MLVAYMLLAFIVVLFATLQNECDLSMWTIQETRFSSFIPYTVAFLFSILILLPLSVFGCNRINAGRTFDSLQAIFYRPNGNGEFVWGIAFALWKIVGTFAIGLFVCAGIIHATVNTTMVNAYEYVFYFTTMLIPSIVFISGLALIIGVWIKKQSIGITLLLILWGMYLLHITKYENMLFDPLGLTLPNVFSEITGHPNLQNYLLQRCCWLFLGLGLICLTVISSERIPNRAKQNKLPAITLLILGTATGIWFWKGYAEDSNARKTYRTIYTNCADLPKTYLLSESIILEEKEGNIQATATLQIHNKTGLKQKQILLFLNPGLKINTIKSGGHPVDFRRKAQLVEVQHKMKVNDTLTLTISYAGKIDEQLCYLDKSEHMLTTKRDDMHRVCRFGKHYIYATPNLTLLIPEALWYPMTEPPVNPASPYNITKNFTSYKLRIRSKREVISQGKRVKEGEWTIFQSDQLLPNLSLCIGDYETCQITVDSIEYEINIWRDHIGLWKKLTKCIELEKEEIIRQIRENAESTYERKYPYKRLKLIETPIALYSYFREYQEGSELVQPELIFFPERSYGMGLKIGEASPHNTLTSLEKFLLNEEVSISPFSWQAALGWHSLQPRLNFSVYDKKNLHTITPMFKSQLIDIYSQEYPCLNIVINKMDKSQSGRNQNYTQSTQKAIDYLSSNSLENALYDKDIDPAVADAILALKGAELMNLLIDHGGQYKHIINFLHDFKQRHSFEQIDLSVMMMEFEERFGWNWSSILQEWYHKNRIPNYVVQMEPILQVEQMENGKRKMRIEFAVYNDSDVEGIISLMAQKRNADAQTQKTEIIHVIKIGPQQGKQMVVLLEDVVRASINTGISENLPRIFTEGITGYFTTDSLTRVENISKDYFFQDSNTYMVDNDDKRCEIKQPFRRFFEKLTQLQGNENNEYANFSERIMYATSRWKKFISENAQGTTIRSFIFKIAGNGKQCVEWTTELPQDGTYEIWAYIPKEAPSNFFINNPVQQYNIFTNTKTKEVVEVKVQSGNWVLLGEFECKAGKNKVLLNDNGREGQVIIADAVKWVLKESI